MPRHPRGASGAGRWYRVQPGSNVVACCWPTRCWARSPRRLSWTPILTAVLLGEEFDKVNLVEELGDDAFYTSLALQAIGGNPEQVVYTNVRKLAKRYKGGSFTREEAVNRNLDVERQSLEDDVLGQDQ